MKGLFVRLNFKVKKLFYTLFLKDSTPKLLELNNQRLRHKGMKVGEGCRIFNDLGVAEPYLVTIGDNVTMSGNVQFITHDGSIVKLGLENATHTLGSIKVGNDCFIGHGAIIMPGVKIGNRSIIGAGAVVTKSVPDGAVACGNPARVISGIEEMAAKLRGKTFDLLSLAPSERKAYVMAHPELLKENWKN